MTVHVLSFQFRFSYPLYANANHAGCIPELPEGNREHVVLRLRGGMQEEGTGKRMHWPELWQGVGELGEHRLSLGFASLTMGLV